MFGNISRYASTHARTVLAVWFCIVCALAYNAAHVADVLSPGGYEVTGESSDVAKHILLTQFPELPISKALIVVHGFESGDVERTASRIVSAYTNATYPGIKSVTYAAPTLYQDTHGEFSVILLMNLSVGLDDSIAFFKKTTPSLQGFATNTTRIHMVAPGTVWNDFDVANQHDLSFAETIQTPLLIAILWYFFSSILLMSVPLIAAGISILSTFGIVYIISSYTPLSVYVQNVVPLIGIGLCIDYSLLIMSRFRSEVARGATTAQAAQNTGSTAGVAVVSSGCTVLLALAGLLFTGIPLFSGLAIGTMLVAIVAIIFSLTGLPALLTLYGTYVGFSHVGTSSTHIWKQWSRWVIQHAFVATFTVLAALCLLIIPVSHMKMGTNGPSTLAPDTNSSIARSYVRNTIGAGMLAPIDVILTSHERIAYNGPEGVFVANTHVSDFISALAKDPRMGTVPIVGVFNNDGSVFKVTIIPTHADDEQETFEFVKRIKELGHSHLDKEHITMAIAGPTSEYSDFTKGITDHLAFVFMFVASISFLILLVLFRSIVIPIKAVVMTILSTTAAYGVLVLVFQYGYAAHLLGFVSSGHITNWVPPFLFCILFGLSVDYEIFILAKTIEYKEIGESDADAITHAIADTAPIITTAAAIMIVTFICFMTNRLLPMKEVSLGLAVAIFIDATLVRLVLVPSLMVIAGKWNWWLPRWLDKILPRIHIRHH